MNIQEVVNTVGAGEVVVVHTTERYRHVFATSKHRLVYRLPDGAWVCASRAGVLVEPMFPSLVEAISSPLLREQSWDMHPHRVKAFYSVIDTVIWHTEQDYE